MPMPQLANMDVGQLSQMLNHMSMDPAMKQKMGA